MKSLTSCPRVVLSCVNGSPMTKEPSGLMTIPTLLHNSNLKRPNLLEPWDQSGFHEEILLTMKLKHLLLKGLLQKRSILSSTSQLFDPLGLLSPVIIVPKTLIQDLWKIGAHWDESIPLYLHTKWRSFRDELQILNDLEIPRQIVCKNTKIFEVLLRLNLRITYGEHDIFPIFLPQRITASVFSGAISTRLVSMC